MSRKTVENKLRGLRREESRARYLASTFAGAVITESWAAYMLPHGRHLFMGVAALSGVVSVMFGAEFLSASGKANALEQALAHDEIFQLNPDEFTTPVPPDGESSH